jgi:hypothetical protein
MMSRKDVLAEFEADFKKAEPDKNGEYLSADLKKRAKRLIITDRSGVIEACKYWISLRQEPYALLAVSLVMDLGIKELKSDLVHLRKDIESGKVFKPYYNELVDKALKAISENG